jgi:arylformamidase
MEIIDISLDLYEDMIFYPGDPEFKLTRVLDMANMGDNLNLSKIEMGVHTGTHVDSPLHFVKDGKNITKFILKKFYGKCKVIDFTSLDYSEKITVIHLKDKKISSNLIVLLKTKNSLLYREEFRKDYVSLSKEGAEFLVTKGVKAVGIDFLSIGNPKTHKTLLYNDVIVYEGLNLAHVDPGYYIFIGFPLKIMNCEGAPTRAVLIKE